MWSRMIYFLPIAAMMSTIKIKEEIKMEGDLQDCLEELFRKNLDSLKLFRNDDLNLRANFIYPAGSNLWTIFDEILIRYHLMADITSNDKTILIKLKEGSAWTHKS